MLSACGLDSGSNTDTSLSSTDTVTSTASTIGASSSASTATGSFSLSWTAPVTRSDGTPLTLSEIAGYRVYYGTSPGNYPNRINISNGSLQSATLTGIPVGTYYVAMSTYDNKGLESNYSSPVVKKAL